MIDRGEASPRFDDVLSQARDPWSDGVALDTPAMVVLSDVELWANEHRVHEHQCSFHFHFMSIFDRLERMMSGRRATTVDRFGEG